MSIWSYIDGVVSLSESVTEDELLSRYSNFSHNLVGSEGGLDISFTRTTKKNWFSSSEREYNVEGITRVSNMVFNGKLRDFDEDDLLYGLEGLKLFLLDLKNNYIIDKATFVLETSFSNNIYYLSFVKGRVRTKKVTIK